MSFDKAIASGCGDFFVVFLSSDKRTAITVNVDRPAAQIGTGTTQVDTSKATVKVAHFSRAVSGAEEYYCNDLPSVAEPISSTVNAASINVTIDHLPSQFGESYRLSIEVKDVDVGGGVVVPTLTGSNLNVGWLAG